MKRKPESFEETYVKEELFWNSFEESDPPWNFIFRDTVDSTNDVAKELAEGGEQEITVVWAEAQTKGRGRMGRAWLSEPHENILLSLLLRPKIPKERIYSITAALSLSVVMAVESMYGLKSRVKWPNDVILNGKKLAGVLTEVSLKGNSLEYVIAGVGINANWAPVEELIYPATCIALETGKRVQREQVAVKVLKQFELLYGLIREKRYEEVLSKWVKKADFFGREVTINLDGRSIQGVPIGLAPNGRLIMEEKGGGRLSIHYGDMRC
ncbi:MAG: biotin--[acetyl-CoA-carboxylase] ligase [Desulfatiglandales bacterium]